MDWARNVVRAILDGTLSQMARDEDVDYIAVPYVEAHDPEWMIVQLAAAAVPKAHKCEVYIHMGDGRPRAAAIIGLPDDEEQALDEAARLTNELWEARNPE